MIVAMGLVERRVSKSYSYVRFESVESKPADDAVSVWSPAKAACSVPDTMNALEALGVGMSELSASHSACVIAFAARAARAMHNAECTMHNVGRRFVMGVSFQLGSWPVGCDENFVAKFSSQGREGVVEAISSGDFIRRNRLPAASTIRSAAAKLKERDLIYRTNGGYVIYDRFFGEWLGKL